MLLIILASLCFFINPYSGEEQDVQVREEFDNTAIITQNHTTSEQLAVPLRVLSWKRTFIGLSNDTISSVHQTSDGGYILAGMTDGAYENDAWFIKIDASGNRLWERILGGLNDDDATSIQQTNDEGYIITGSTRSYGTGNDDVWLIKTDSEGNEVWNETFGGDGWDSANSIQQTSDGGYIIAGNEESDSRVDRNSVAQYAWVIKTDLEGNEVWNKTFGGEHWGSANSIEQTSDGGYILVGENEYLAAWLIKTDAICSKEWDKTFDGAEQYIGTSVQQTRDGGYIVAGITYNFVTENKDSWLIKTDAYGNV